MNLKKYPIIFLTITYALFLIIFNFLGVFNKSPKNDVSNYASSDVLKIEGRVFKIIKITENKITFILKTNKVNDVDANGNILVNYFTRYNDILIGDVILLSEKLNKVAHPKNPGEFDYAKYLKHKNIYCTIYTSNILKIDHISPPFYVLLAANIRKNIIETIRKNLPETESKILISMLVGEKSSFTYEEKTLFADAGLMHILVVSGLHVGYVTAICWGLFRILGLSIRTSSLCTLPFIIIYMLIAGANPPVIRASIMASFIIISLSLSRPVMIYQSLSLAALIIMIFNPKALFSASFQLSFAATIGIVYLYPHIIKLFNKTPIWFKRYIGSIFAVTLSAQISIMPLIAYYFNKISIMGFFSNLIVLPFVGIIIAFGFILYLFNFVSLSGFISSIVYFPLHIIFQITKYFANLPISVIHTMTPSIFFIVCYYFILIAIFKIKQKPKLIYIIGIITCFFVSCKIYGLTSSYSKLNITFLSVRNGTAIHLKFPDGQNWLMFGGNHRLNSNVGQRIISPYLISKGINNIDKIIITSDIYKSMKLLNPIYDNFCVSEILASGSYEQTTYFPIKQINSSHTIVTGESYIKFIPYAISNGEENNNIILFQNRKHKILFINDPKNTTIGSIPKIETDILFISGYPELNILNELTKYLKPTYTIISTNKKLPYTLKKQNIYITENTGAIFVKLTKNKIKLKTFSKS